MTSPWMCLFLLIRLPRIALYSFSPRCDMTEPKNDRRAQGPLADLDDWETAVIAEKGPEGTGKTTFRDYRVNVRPGVREFYRLNHTHQTLDFVREKKRHYLSTTRREMGVWEAMEYLNTLVDDSDPDTELSQIEHLMQTAEAIRADGHPRWFILTGLVHDLGKVLCLFGEPQWAVVGDTFPVGCRYSDRIVFPECFADNPDYRVPEYQTPCGIYEPGCGLDNVHLSWGHDEYLYHVVKEYLPEQALAMIRYHSFYAWHQGGAYSHLMNQQDHEMLRWVRAFNPYDLYSKGHERPDVAALTPYYKELIAEYFPSILHW
jgi:inositol oxygenase